MIKSACRVTLPILLLLATGIDVVDASPLRPVSATPDSIDIADPNQSIFQSVLGRSPKNVEVGDPGFQYIYQGRLMDLLGVPIQGWPLTDIQLEILTPCQNPIVLHPIANSGPDGLVMWNAASLDQMGGGACQGQEVVVVRLVSIGVFKTLNFVVSPDENGDGLIGLGDLSTFQQAFINGGPPYQGDLNQSGGPPDLADLQFFQRHFTAP
jgi:hypothetical protein